MADLRCRLSMNRSNPWNYIWMPCYTRYVYTANQQGKVITPCKHCFKIDHDLRACLHQLLQFPPGHITQGAPLFWKFECSYTYTLKLVFSVYYVLAVFHSEWCLHLVLIPSAVVCELISLQCNGTCFAPCIATQEGCQDIANSWCNLRMN